MIFLFKLWCKLPGRINTSKLVFGSFLKRLNRFTVLSEVNGKIVKAYLPNPGRLWEILLPGRILYLCPQDPPENLPFTVMAAEMGGHPVMLHTHLTNDYAQTLLREGLIPGLENFRPIRREVRVGSSRFDFLLAGFQDSCGLERLMALEVKTCTLFGHNMAFFPDAITLRGRRHLEELARLKEERGWEAGVLFIVFWPEARYFIPEYHTDMEFARTLLRLRHSLFVQAISVELEKDLRLKPEPPRSLKIPWNLIASEAQDRGAYILIFEVEQTLKLSIGKIGDKFLPRGFYLYVGSAQNGLEARLAPHRRKGKNLFWHVDYLREKARLRHALAIRTPSDLECSIARSLSRFARVVSGFGSSDCSCEGHLFALDEDPLQFPPFIALLHEFRYQRLEEKLAQENLFRGPLYPWNTRSQNRFS